MTRTKRHIGGSFELDIACLFDPVRQEIEDYFGLGANDAALNSGRAALRVILQALSLGKREILIPDFLCGQVLLPVLNAESQRYAYYPVNADLNIDVDALRNAIDRTTGAILLIDYFGLTDHSALACDIRSWGFDGHIVHDQVQALYAFRATSDASRPADFAFISFRKFLSVPGGAYVRGQGPFAPISQPHAQVSENCYVAAAALRQAYVTCYSDLRHDREVEETYIRLFEMAEHAIGSTPAGLSTLCREMIRRLPLDAIADRRRANFAALTDALDGSTCLRLLRRIPPVGAVPMAMPVIVEGGKRDALRSFLKERDIFCPVHWPLASELRRNAPPERQYLADNILSFPIDQRYTPAELDRVAEVVRQFEKTA